jgi:hypothetical protein
LGLESGPKWVGFGLSVRTQNEFKCGSFPVRTQEGCGLGPWLDPVGFGSFRVRTQKGWVWVLSSPNPIWVRLAYGSETKGVWVWVLPCSNPKWLGVGSMSIPKGVGGWVHIRTQRDLGPSQSGPKMVLGVSPFISGPKRVKGWVRVQTQGGLGPSVFRPNMSWGWSVGPDPRVFGFGSVRV